MDINEDFFFQLFDFLYRIDLSRMSLVCKRFHKLSERYASVMTKRFWIAQVVIPSKYCDGKKIANLSWDVGGYEVKKKTHPLHLLSQRGKYSKFGCEIGLMHEQEYVCEFEFLGFRFTIQFENDRHYDHCMDILTGTRDRTRDTHITSYSVFGSNDIEPMSAAAITVWKRA